MFLVVKYHFQFYVETNIPNSCSDVSYISDFNIVYLIKHFIK